MLLPRAASKRDFRCLKIRNSVLCGGPVWVGSNWNESNIQNRLRFVCTHIKSCDQSLDKTSFDFSSIFRVMQTCAMSAKSSIILQLPKSTVT